LLGVGYVHLIKKNKDKEYNRASWVGLAVWVVFIIMITAFVLFSFLNDD
jgi:hypothetical protein